MVTVNSAIQHQLKTVVNRHRYINWKEKVSITFYRYILTKLVGSKIAYLTISYIQKVLT